MKHSPDEGAVLAPETTQHIIHRSDNRPIRFEGSVIGSGSVYTALQESDFYTRVRLFRTKSGSYVWAWDRSVELEPKSPGDLERADAHVVKRTEFDRDDAAFAESVWRARPQVNAKLADAATQAWLEAGGQDGLLALYLHEDVD